ncbi:MAG: type II toxin-antitoxin system Phd/YefM family antitoxin [Myxococcota bacterium]
MHRAKTHLSRLVEDALAGEEVVIALAGKPRVRLVPVEEGPKVRLGRLAGAARWDAEAWAEGDREVEALVNLAAERPPPDRKP